MIPVTNFGVEWLTISFPFPCEIHHCFVRNIPDNEKYRVLLHTGEPSPLKMPADDVRKIQGHFDLILSSDRSLSDLLNFRHFIFGDSWIKSPPNMKQYGTSFLYSAGCGASLPGYAKRREVWLLQKKIRTPNVFWLSANRTPKDVLGETTLYPYDSKNELFIFMFSICIENFKENDYFTEKILDAFQTFTIPLYYGCPNISTHFNSRGIISFESADELLKILNSLTVETYWNRLQYVHENFEASKNYLNPLNRIQTTILEEYFRSKDKLQ